MDEDLSDSVDTADLLKEWTRWNEQLHAVISRVSALRRQGAVTGLTESIRSSLQSAKVESDAIVSKMKRIEEQLLAAFGLTEEMIAAVEDEIEISDPVDHTARASVTGDQINPTGMLEEITPVALERLLAKVDSEWLNGEKEKDYRLGEDFLQQPLVLIRGLRVESEVRQIHRFAQSLLVAQDYVERDAAFDWFAGALLVPQVAALGLKLPDLASVCGEVTDRVSALWRYSSNSADSTVYELLVAASCARWGRDMEFLPAGQGAPGQKTPDLRVHGYPFPVVVECKRRTVLTDADAAEGKIMEAVLAGLRSMCERRGLWGVFNVRLAVSPEDLPVQEVLDAAVRQPYARDPRESVEYGWGSLALQPLPRRVFVPDTTLYSPIFLQTVFGWDTDLPPYDGIACQVRAPGELLVGEARDPVAITWTNDNPSVFRRRARTASGLYGSAMAQVGAGEVGIIYVCYQEGDRESVADDRTRYMTQQLHEWAHSWTIQVPISVLSRIVPRPLAHGTPDLIETGIQFVSSVYGDPVWFKDFPTAVFTK